MSWAKLRVFAARPGIKFTAGVLLILSVLICVISGSGILLLSRHNAYTDGGVGLRDELIAELLQVDAAGVSEQISHRGSWIRVEAQRQKLERELNERFDPEDSNLLYTVYNLEGGAVLLANEFVTESEAMFCVDQCFTDPASLEQSLESFPSREEALSWLRENSKYPGFFLLGLEWNEFSDGSLSVLVKRCNLIRCRICLNLRRPMEAADKYKLTDWTTLSISRHRYLILLGTGLSFVAALALFGLLLLGSGRRPGTDNLYLTPWDGTPFDLYFIIMAILAWFPDLLLAALPDLRTITFQDAMLRFSVGSIVLAYRTVIALMAGLGAARRHKAGTLLRNLFLYRILSALLRALRQTERGVPIFLRMLGFYLLVSGIELLFLLFAQKQALIWFWVVEKLLIGILGAVVAADLAALEREGDALRKGDVDYTIQSARMLPVLRRHSENLNGIREGLQRTLDEQTRSERMKAELITNVSHDLKTPLTSIVNYVSLLKMVPPGDPIAREYLEVLDRQSVRLKKLVVDLVEASKAATGSMMVERETVDMNLLLSQAAGEYEERMAARGQELVVALEDGLPMIQADPKLLWRIFDNLLGNALLYSQRGTRIYLSSDCWEGQARFMIRNVSDQKLNIRPEELMERFVRGDSSRYTEGSGLGLSIARSLTELQGGRFRIEIDGDLFKAIICFPLELPGEGKEGMKV